VLPYSMALRSAVASNQFLDSLPKGDLRTFRLHLELVSLVAGEMLERAGTAPTHIVFPVKGAVSLEARSGWHTMQVALVGTGGVVGAVPALCDGISTHDAVVQFAGHGWRMSAQKFSGRLAGSGDLHRRLASFAADLIAEISFNALVVGRSTIRQRLARWLLIAADALESHDVPATHALIAHSLGVRRPGVTDALHILEEMQAVAVRRSYVTILRRANLRAAAGKLW
jgi:CRP-like cAMP-binding protein